MRCVCGFGDPMMVRRAKIKHGQLTCPYCAGRIVCEPAIPPPGLRCSAEAYALIAPIVRRRKQESFWVFYVDPRNRVIGKREVCRGSLASCSVHPREVFGPAYTRRAAAIIVAHNHPSGDPTPSQDDERLTDLLCRIGQMMGIPVLDHLVVGKDGYYSFRDQGKLVY